MVPRVSPRAMALRLSTFVGDVEPTNIVPYIRRCHVTDEYVGLYSSAIYLLASSSVNRRIYTKFVGLKRQIFLCVSCSDTCLSFLRFFFVIAPRYGSIWVVTSQPVQLLFRVPKYVFLFKACPSLIQFNFN
jgi:hypothetical protein